MGLCSYLIFYFLPICRPDGALPDADENIGEDSLLVIKPGNVGDGSEDGRRQKFGRQSGGIKRHQVILSEDLRQWRNFLKYPIVTQMGITY